MNSLIQVRPPGSHASIFGCSLACAARSAVPEPAGEPGFGGRMAACGESLLDGLCRPAGEVPLIGDGWEISLICGIDRVSNPATKGPAAKGRDRVPRGTFERGLELLLSGESVSRSCPPPITRDGEIDNGLDSPREAFPLAEAAHG